MGYKLLEKNIHVLKVNKPGDLKIVKINLNNPVIYQDEQFIKLLKLVNTNKSTEYVVNEGIRIFNEIKNKYSNFLIYNEVVAFKSNKAHQTVDTIVRHSIIKPSNNYLENETDYYNDKLFSVEPYTKNAKSDYTLLELIDLIKITFINYEHKKAVYNFDRTSNLIQNFIGGDYNNRGRQRIYLDNRIEAEIITNYGYGAVSYLVCNFYIDGEKKIYRDRLVTYRTGREPKNLEFTKSFRVEDFNTFLLAIKYIKSKYKLIKESLEV